MAPKRARSKGQADPGSASARSPAPTGPAKPAGIQKAEPRRSCRTATAASQALHKAASMAAPSPTPGPSRPSPTPAAPPSRWTARIESSFEAPIVRPGDYPTRHSTTPNVPIASRAKGCLWGLCVCDALGGAVQFDDPRHVPEVTGLRPIAGFHKPAGSYSDDGAMAIALTKSMIEQGGAYSQVEALERYLNWLHRGHYVAPAGHAAWDVGRGTLNSLRFWEQFTKEHERPTIREGVRLAADLFPIWPKSDNGSLMRMAPVGALFYLSLSAARRVAREDSDLTHPSQQCSDICALYVTLVAYCFVPGMTKEIMMMTVATVDIAERELRMLMRTLPRTLGEWQSLEIQDIAPDPNETCGYVFSTIKRALWAFFKFDDFKTGILQLIKTGGDTDTNGAVYGGLAGAWYGLEAIPEEWRAGMQQGTLIEETAQGLATLVSTNPRPSARAATAKAPKSAPPQAEATADEAMPDLGPD